MSMRLMHTGIPCVEHAAADTPAPPRLGRYTLLNKLGEGAMGVVYRAHDPLLERSVALKTFRAPAGAGVAASLRLRREAQAAARLSHPGIVAIHEYGEDGTQSFIAMEYVRGRSLLGALTQPQPLPIDDVLCLMVQLLDALQCAHEQGVWHRDIKPSNLMITHEGRLKITDFGVARIDDDAAAPARERGVVGSPGYLAPECYRRDAAVDQRADLYACGVLLFELLTGARPYRGSPDVVMYKTLHLPVPPLAVPGDAQFVALSRFAHVVQRALAKSPHERCASALEMRQALTLAADRAVPQALSAPALRLLLQASSGGERVLPVLYDVVSEAPKTPTAATTLPAPLLSAVQRLLARQIGPIAPLLVRRAAAGATTRESFIARLASLAGEGGERDALHAALVKLGR
jgi:eukaryotic-like serine/threonine-protein kinase